MSRPALHIVQTPVTEDGEVGGCENCRAALEEAEIWEKRVLELEGKLARAQLDKEAQQKKDKDYAAAQDLFDEWRRECAHPNAKFDANRTRLALLAVRRYKGHRDKLSYVIQHGRHLAYVNPKTGSKKDSFGLLFRDSDQIETRANEYYRWASRTGVLAEHTRGLLERNLRAAEKAAADKNVEHNRAAS